MTMFMREESLIVPKERGLSNGELRAPRGGVEVPVCSDEIDLGARGQVSNPQFHGLLQALELAYTSEVMASRWHHGTIAPMALIFFVFFFLGKNAPKYILVSRAF